MTRNFENYGLSYEIHMFRAFGSATGYWPFLSPRVSMLIRAQARSGTPIYLDHERVELVPETPIFMLDRELVPEQKIANLHNLPRTKIYGASTPPPPPPRGCMLTCHSILQQNFSYSYGLCYKRNPN